MKSIKLLILAICVFLFYNCDKSEDTIPTQNFLESFAADSLYRAPTIQGGTPNSFFDFGFNFQANKAGKITRVAVRCPLAGTHKVTLWDTDTKTILFTKSIEQEQAATKKWVSVDPVPLAANKKYTFTLLSNSWNNYVAKKPITFPYTKNNIVYLGYSWGGTTAGVNKFPPYNDNSYYAGDADFTFQPD
ncbi:MAG: hypothetical protein ACRCVT_11925 [Leadbetterella sp.]